MDKLSHAGGVIFYDEPITKTTALMKTSNGDIVTQFELHSSEKCGLIKIDLLSIEALDRIRACLDLLVEYGYIDGKNKSLKEIYEEAIGIYNIERNEEKMWKMLHEHKVEALFQMEQQSGIKGISLAKPTTVEELASINSVMRLMAPEKGAEQPLETFAKRKNNSNIWEREMIDFGLTVEERKWLHSYLDASYGICETQETLMIMLQDEKIGGHSLLFSDRVRKAIAKKKPEEFLKCQEEYYQVANEKNLSEKLVHYCWDVVFAASRGYSFCMAHTLAYSLVGLQELNLAYKYPIIFWNTANLIVDSGSMNLDKEFEDYNEETEESIEDEDEDEIEEKKLKNSSCDYGRIATAIGKMKAANISFTCPDINKSNITFIPDLENETIIYGLRGITRIGNQLIKDIISNRPYSSIEDFLSKVKINKVQMINLIKAGTFDSLYSGERTKIMDSYIELISDKKKRITLQNMMMLIKFNLIPQEYELEIKIFNFNKYLKANKDGLNYIVDEVAMPFYTAHFNEDYLSDVKVDGEYSTALINQKTWDNLYKKAMDPLRAWMKENQQEILDNLNQKLYEEAAEKYTEGNVSKWEMDSLSFYYHKHELEKLNNGIYDVVDYESLPDEPKIDKVIPGKNGDITLYEITRIAGTVIDKNKIKNMITLLTPTGVVTVKVWKSQFTVWDRQLSQKDSDGKKHVIEKSWFTRGNKLIISGIKKEGCFIPKVYKNTTYPLFEKINEIDSKGFIINSQTTRAEVEE